MESSGEWLHGMKTCPTNSIPSTMAIHLEWISTNNNTIFTLTLQMVKENRYVILHVQSTEISSFSRHLFVTTGTEFYDTWQQPEKPGTNCHNDGIFVSVLQTTFSKQPEDSDGATYLNVQEFFLSQPDLVFEMKLMIDIARCVACATIFFSLLYLLYRAKEMMC